MNNLNDGPERVEEAVDDLARRAGASLRRSAPEGGASAVMSRGSTIRARRVVIGGGTVAVLLIGTLVLRNGRSDSNPDADLPITTTTSATTSTPNATLAPLSATTLAATTTAVAAFTDTATPTSVDSVDPEVRWALNYVAGSSTAPTGATVRIGYVTDPDYPDYDAGVDAAVRFVNSELGGVKGRPLEVVTCKARDRTQATACGEQMRDDPSISTIVIGTLDFAEFNSAVANKLVLNSAPGVLYHTTEESVSVAETPVFFPYGYEYPGLVDAMTTFVATRLDPPAATIGVLIHYGKSVEVQQAIEVFNGRFPGTRLIGVRTFPSPGLLADELVAQGADKADAFVVVGAPGDCSVVRRALTQLGNDSPVISDKACLHDESWDRVGLAPEGWYEITTGFNPYADDISSGWPTVRRQLSGDPELPQSYVFANVLTSVRVLNALETDEPSGADARAAFRAMPTAAMLQAGDLTCGKVTSVTGSVNWSCGGRLGVIQLRNGEWIDAAVGDESMDITTTA